MHVRTRWCWVGLVAAAALTAFGETGCSRSTATAPPIKSNGSPSSAKGDSNMALKIQSPAFASGERIPKKFTGEGDDLSPALTWTGVPKGTVELALIMDDPDAPSGTWVHWVIGKIPATATGLKEGVAKTAAPSDPPGAVQGKNSWPKTGYNGPMPPRGHGPHRYYFKLYALDTALSLSPAFTKEDLLAAMEGHVLAQSEYLGTYER